MSILNHSLNEDFLFPKREVPEEGHVMSDVKRRKDSACLLDLGMIDMFGMLSY
jgi:hypothetical protein